MPIGGSTFESSIRQIKEERESLQELYNELREEYRNCKTKSDKKDLLVEIEQIEEESQSQTAIADANDLTFMLTARLDEMKSVRENMEIKLGYVNVRLQRDENSNDDEREGREIHDEDAEESSTQNDSVPSCSQNPAPNTRPIIQTEVARTNLRSIKPPQATLLKFYGNPDEFPEYWAVFEALVHNCNELDVMEKILLLKESLRGKAQTAIEGIKLVPENYTWIIDTLKESYCNYTTNRSQIVQKLVNMRFAFNTADSCTGVFDQIRVLTNHMISAGYDVRKTYDPMWCETILSKFPEDIVKPGLVASQSQDKQTIDDLLALLKKEIAAKSYVESRLCHKQFNGVNRSKDKSINPRPTSGVICSFCHKSNHLSMQCRTVTDPNTRRKILKEQNCCWKCCSSSHKSFDCQKPDCGQKHHISVCFKNEQPQNNRNFNQGNKIANGGQNYQKPQNWQGRDQNRRRDFQKPSPANSQTGARMNSFEHTSANKQLILMTAEGNIWNAKEGEYEKILFFFDSGAQKTVTEENLADRLGLPRHTTEICTMSGIGGHIECFKSHIVPVRLGTAFGEEIDITIQTKPVITNGFPSVNLDQKDIEFLKTNNLCLANTKLRGEHQNPHILVGLDYYHDLVTNPANGMQTPSGFHIAKTVFGPTIYGRGIGNVSATASAMYHSLTNICTPTEEELLQKIFEIDGLGITQNECQGDEKAQKYFEEYSQKISSENSVITAPFPLKENVTELEDKYSVAIGRLESLQVALQNNPEQLIWYKSLVQKYADEGIIETFQRASQDAAGIYYMPHSGVWRPHKKAPLIIVFDASSTLPK
ncbi:hypothetical protein Y032_0221g2542 [Ancylostoma ceylanicum]|uniref:Peptidase A2 domain-containing protein n=1 Tax=Ancylostoma ceylanicum TaxID=53326 RepID=A0A016SHW7_9BILA|nr:hypothetical protein Y032_0221g2542 [Ancylostoma ceylanicum]